MVNNRIDEECQPLVQSQDRYPAYDAPTNKDVATEDGGNHIIALSNPPVWFVYIVAGCAGINSCNVGFDIGVNSPAGILVQEDMSLSDLQLEMFMGKSFENRIVGYASENLKEPPLSFLPTPSPTQVPLTCLRSLEL